jgi:hypothetical protein
MSELGIQATSTGVLPKVPFPAPHLSRIMVNTFRLSRGLENSHEPQLAYMAKNYGEQIKAADQESAEHLTLQAALGMIASSLHPTYSNVGRLDDPKREPLSDDAEGNVAEAYQKLHDLIDGHKIAPSTPGVLLAALIRADARWRPSVPGPLERDKSYKPSSYTSNVVRYVIMGELINVNEIEEMLRVAESALEEGDNGEVLFRSLRLSLPQVIRAHLEFHETDRNAINKILKTKTYFKRIGGQSDF